jgi:hypothetical protein
MMMFHKVIEIGKTVWAFSDGHIPLESLGPEPANTSHDRISILNATSEEADVQLMIYFIEQDPKGPYSIRIKAQRVKQVRLNDLIDPEALPLDVSYGCVITSNCPIIVQFGRLDTSWPPKGMLSHLAF